jgi:hypothetical protein
MNFLKKLFGKNSDVKQKSESTQQSIPYLGKNEKPRGLIRYVLLVTSLPTQPTNPQMASFLMDLLPELDSQQDGTAKIGFLWETKSMHLIDIQALAVESFGNIILDSNKYIYRTQHIKLKTGEAKCFIVYDKDSN